MIQPMHFRFFFLIVLLTGLAGCSSNQEQASVDAATITLQTFNDDINTTIQQVYAVQAALDKLRDPAQPDLEKAFNDYSNTVSDMKSIQEKFLLHAEGMRVYGVGYFRVWEKTINDEFKDPLMQQLTDQRRATVRKMYEDITDDGIALEADLRDFVSDITLIENGLSTDLSKENIADLDKIAQRVVSESNDMVDVMLNVQEAIKNTQIEMSSMGPSEQTSSIPMTEND